MNAPGTDWVLSEEGNRLYNRLRRFLSRPQEVGYLFMTATDERLMPIINQKLMQEVPGLGIFFWQDSDQPFVQQLLDFAATHSAIVVANLSGMARRQPTFLQSLNFAREQLNGLEKPIGFWLTPATIKQVANKAADLYSQRQYTSLAFEDKLPQEASSKALPTLIHKETEEVQAQIALLEEHLRTALTTNRPPSEIAQTIALPLAKAYAEDGQGSKALELLDAYLNNLDRENSGILFRIADIYKGAFDYERALMYYKASINRSNDDNAKANAYQLMGDIYQAQDRLDLALQAFVESNKLSENLYQNNPDSEWLKSNLAISYGRLGIIYQKQRELDLAVSHFKQSYTYIQELVKQHPDSENYMDSLAFSYRGIGDVHQEQGQLELALSYFENANKLAKTLYQLNPRSEWFKDSLAVCCARLGEVYQAQGQFKLALNYFEQYNHLAEELFQSNPRSVRFSNVLSVSYWNLGNLYREMGESTKARSYFQQCAACLSDLCEQVSLPQYEANLAEVRRDLAGLA